MRLLGINSDFFLQKDFTHKKSAQNVNKRLSFRFSYAKKALKANKQLSLINNIKSKQTNLNKHS